MLLAIDTSTALIGLALYDGTRVHAELSYSSGLHHTRELAPALARLLESCGIKMTGIQALGTAIGPGSFTSLRVGLAFVKGLALACHLPVVGVPTLDIVAAGVPLSDRRLAAVLQAGRGRLAAGWYKAGEAGWQAEGKPYVTTAEEMVEKIHKRVLICGELTDEDRHRLGRKFKNVEIASPVQCVRRPAILAEIAWKRWQAGEVDPTATIAPIYIHVAGGPPE